MNFCYKLVRLSLANFSNVCGRVQEPTLEWSTCKVLHPGSLQPYILGWKSLPGKNALAYYENL